MAFYQLTGNIMTANKIRTLAYVDWLFSSSQFQHGEIIHVKFSIEWEILFNKI